MKRFGLWRAIKLWWSIRAIAKIARQPMGKRCDLCGHRGELHGWQGCGYHDSEGPCMCPRGRK